MCACYVLSCSVVSNSLQPTRLLCPWGFSRQEYWSRLPCPPSGDLPDPGIKRMSFVSPDWQTSSLPLVPPGKLPYSKYSVQFNRSVVSDSLRPHESP